jgi:hypothetical protein
MPRTLRHSHAAGPSQATAGDAGRSSAGVSISGVVSIALPLAYFGLVAWLSTDMPVRPLRAIFPYLLVGQFLVVVLCYALAIRTVRSGNRGLGWAGIVVSSLSLAELVWWLVEQSHGAQPGIG